MTQEIKYYTFTRANWGTLLFKTLPPAPVTVMDRFRRDCRFRYITGAIEWAQGLLK